MIVRLAPSVINGQLQAQPSKSDAHRKILCAAFAHGTSRIDNVILSQDILASIRGGEAAGADINIIDSIVFSGRKCLEIKGTGGKCKDERDIDCGESGSTLRFLSMIYAAAGGSTRLTGEGRLPLRPMAALLEFYDKNEIEYTIPGEGRFLPLEFCGELNSGAFSIDCSVTSQFLSGLMMGLSAAGKSGTIYTAGNFESKGYVDVTAGVLKEFGIQARGSEPFEIPENKGLTAQSTYVEGDWSNASYFILMKNLGADIKVSGLRDDSYQPDAIVQKHLKNIKSNKDHSINVSECPDLMPTLAVYGAASDGVLKLTGGRRLRAKESDRISSVAMNLKNIGVDCIEFDEGLEIRSNGVITGGNIDSCNDHRIAMAFSALCVVSKGDIIINGAECVSKSYPDFYKDLIALGGIVK